MKYPCKSCGACCKTMAMYPTLDRGDGTCRHYDEEARLCKVYEERPLVCRIDRIYAERMRPYMEPRRFYGLQVAVCMHVDPDNADMPERTRAALREAGLPTMLDLRNTPQVIAKVIAQAEKAVRPEDTELQPLPPAFAAGETVPPAGSRDAA